MTFDEFVAQYTGKGIDTDGAFGFQCMDLMHKYVVEVLGLDVNLFAAPTAYQAYVNANDSRFDKIPNTPTGVPQNGDIMFWDTSIGNAGHVAVFLSGDTNSFKSFDQNWPTGSLSHIQDHTYKGVAGWLHCKTQQDQQSVIDEIRTARDNNWNLYQTEVSINNDLKKQIQAEQQKNQDLRNANDSLTKADADTGAQLLDAQHAVNEFISALGLPAGTSNQVALDKITGLLKPHEDMVKQVQPTIDALADAAIMKRAPKKTQSLLDKLKSFFKL